MNKHEAYSYQLSRLTEEEKTMLNMKESRIGRRLLPWEVVAMFRLDHESVIPKSVYEPQYKEWMDQ